MIPTHEPPMSLSRRFLSNRVLVTALMAFTLVLYLWNAPNAIDYPQYDESIYFYSGYQLSIGNLDHDWTWSPQGSPLISVFYAVFIALLDTSKVYPWLHTFSLFLVGMGAYLLLSRILHPLLSWLLATMVIIASAPAVPENTLYYLSSALLWLSLSLLGKRPIMRGLSVFCILITVYMRPEFLLCLFTLLIALCLYERRELLQRRVRLQTLALVYAPVGIGLIATFLIWAQAPEFVSLRGVNVLPWSYNNFYRDVYPDQFQGYASYGNVYLLFEQDFGTIAQRSTSSIALAMLRNIPKLIEYLAYSSTMLWASYATSLFAGFSWQLPAYAVNLMSESPPNYNLQLGIGVIALAILTGLSYRHLRRQHRLPERFLPLNNPALLGFLALLPLVIVLMLLVPQLRYFQIFPLVLLPVGGALTLILMAIRPPRWSRVLLVAGVLVLIPHPYVVTQTQPISNNIALLRRHVQEGDKVIGGSMLSYTYYLQGEGVDVAGVDSAWYTEPTLVNAIESDLAITHVFVNQIFPSTTYQQWMSEWYNAYPDSPLVLVEQQDSPYSALYRVPSDSLFHTRFSYRNFQRQAQTLGQDMHLLPPPEALDFGQRVTWMSDNPNHNLAEKAYNFWNAQAYTFRMSAYYPDMPQDIPTQVYASLPASWSGRSLLFLATIAPYLLDGRADTDGVIVQMTVDANGQAETTSRLLNNIEQQNYVVLRLDLPAYTGEARLTVAIDPRETTYYDLLHLTHVGVLK